MPILHSEMEVKEIEFEKLKHAYVTVKNFLETEGWEKVTSLDNKVEADLGLFGDDNYEFLQKFVTKFELDYKNFDYNKHFYSEGELFGGGEVILTLLALSVWLPLKTIELITFNKTKLDKPDFHRPPERADLTFKDLITWYVEKEFKPGNGIKYRIKPASAYT